MPDRNKGSCLDLRLPGTGLNRGMGEGEKGTVSGPGPASREGKDQWKSRRDGGNIMRNEGNPIQDVMPEDQRPKE